MGGGAPGVGTIKRLGWLNHRGVATIATISTRYSGKVVRFAMAYTLSETDGQPNY